MACSDLSGLENHSRNDAASRAWLLSIIRHKAFRDIVAFVERHGLLEKFYILTFCLFYAVPNVWSARSCLYWFVLPLFLIVVPRDPLLRILRAPLLLVCMAFFLIVIVAAPFAQEVVPRQIGTQVRILLVLTAFLVVTAYLAYRDRDFPYRFFLYVSCTAAIGAALTVWNHLLLNVPASEIPTRLEGVPGMIVYYNPSFVGAIYGFACVGAAAAATRPGISRGEFSILALAAAILGYRSRPHIQPAQSARRRAGACDHHRAGAEPSRPFAAARGLDRGAGCSVRAARRSLYGQVDVGSE